MKDLLLATGNPGKFKEIAEVFRGLNVQLKSLMDMGLSGEGLIEDGKTFRENAYKKAKFFYEKSGMMTLAEDSGILVEALKDELGVQTRRWGAGEKATDQEWIEYFLKKMEGATNRRAAFYCEACLIVDGEPFYFEGKTEGEITFGLEAEILPGLPLSSCFKPDGYDRVYAALSVKEKNLISHRGKAVGKVANWIADNVL